MEWRKQALLPRSVYYIRQCGPTWLWTPMRAPASRQSQGELATMALFLRDRAVLLNKRMEIVHTGSETQHPPQNLDYSGG